MTVQHEDLVLLYVLTRLHPKLPEHIRDKFEDSDSEVQDLIVEILLAADSFLQGDQLNMAVF